MRLLCRAAEACYNVGVRAHSSSGPGRRPLKAEIRGSNPLCAKQKRNEKHELCSCFSFLSGGLRLYETAPLTLRLTLEASSAASTRFLTCSFWRMFVM